MWAWFSTNSSSLITNPRSVSCLIVSLTDTRCTYLAVNRVIIKCQNLKSIKNHTYLICLKSFSILNRVKKFSNHHAKRHVLLLFPLKKRNRLGKRWKLPWTPVSLCFLMTSIRNDYEFFFYPLQREFWIRRPGKLCMKKIAFRLKIINYAWWFFKVALEMFKRWLCE